MQGYVVLSHHIVHHPAAPNVVHL